jgi:hypothetical protein
VEGDGAIAKCTEVVAADDIQSFFTAILPEVECKTLCLRLSAHQQLESTLFLLRLTDPEEWTKENRVSILSCLVDQCAMTASFKTTLGPYTKSNTYTMVNDIPSTPFTESISASGIETSQSLEAARALLGLEAVKVTARSACKCYFSGADPKCVESSLAQTWVFVPAWLMEPPQLQRLPEVPISSLSLVDMLKLMQPVVSTSAGSELESYDAKDSESSKAGNRQTRGARVDLNLGKSKASLVADRPVALESAVLLMLSARVVAMRENLRVQVNCFIHMTCSCITYYIFIVY